MIIGSRKAPTQPSPSSQAEKTLPTAEFLFASGNCCRVTPCMRPLAEDPEKCTIVITYGWHKSPSPEDKAEIETVVKRMLGNAQSLGQIETKDRREGERIRDEFLNPGRRH